MAFGNVRCCPANQRLLQQGDRRKKDGYLGRYATENKLSKFNYWAWWKYCTSEIKIPPSEVWGLDFVEIKNLVDAKNTNADLSLMLNYERVKNGASKQWLARN